MDRLRAPAARRRLRERRGLRAATWAAGILGRLDALQGFRPATRLMTGASGGMVAGAAWIAAAHSGARLRPLDLMRAFGTVDALSPVARRLVFHDVALAFLPFVNRGHRGAVLEHSIADQLSTALGCPMQLPLSALQDAEAAATLPSLVFSPMIVEDGRRLLVSNLDVTPATEHSVRWLSSAATGATPSTALASGSGVHVACIDPVRWSSLPLFAAAGLSAAFPYVSPAAILPTTPRRRVVDAGYFDNYGLELGCAWLRLLATTRAEWFRAHVSRVLVIQIRDEVPRLSAQAYRARSGGAQHAATAAGGALARGLEGIISPPEGLLAAREAAMLFRNDAQLEALADTFAGCGLPPGFLTTTVFEFRGEASLSWTLARAEVAGLLGLVRSRGITQKLNAIAAWL